MTKINASISLGTILIKKDIFTVFGLLIGAASIAQTESLPVTSIGRPILSSSEFLRATFKI